MSPMVKRIAAAIAVKKAIDVVQARRRPPRRSLVARFGLPTLALATAGGALAYLGTTGRLQSVVGKVRGNGRSQDRFEASQDGPAPATS
jgi:hypothetical protein